mmetsp:Transcript_15486/g.32651  ORF Transcript_15486/g.32651 Transcript_15486/m.32651 type:complete len:317 (-) Transcript_15486:981-1931(-)
MDSSMTCSRASYPPISAYCPRRQALAVPARASVGPSTSLSARAGGPVTGPRWAGRSRTSSFLGGLPSDRTRSFCVTPFDLKSSSSGQPSKAFRRMWRCRMTTSTGPLARKVPASTTGTPRSASGPTREPGPSNAWDWGGGGGSGGSWYSCTSSSISSPAGESSRFSLRTLRATSAWGSPQSQRQSVVAWPLRSKRPASDACRSFFIASLKCLGSTTPTKHTCFFFRASSASAAASSSTVTGGGIQFSSTSETSSCTSSGGGSRSRPSPIQLPLRPGIGLQFRGKTFPPQPGGTSASTSPRRIMMRQSPATPFFTTV